jgi:threonine dehydrogenase-like Zn-dependent dehydrogenase
VTRYGPPEVLDLREVERPSAGDGDILIRVHATTVTAADYRLRALNMPAGMRLMGRLAIGVRRPRKPVLGQVVSGTAVHTCAQRGCRALFRHCRNSRAAVRRAASDFTLGDGT